MDGLWIAMWDAVLRLAPYVIPMLLLIFLVKYLFRPGRKNGGR
jgi:hypothetical protein